MKQTHNVQKHASFFHLGQFKLESGWQGMSNEFEVGYGKK